MYRVENLFLTIIFIKSTNNYTDESRYVCNIYTHRLILDYQINLYNAAWQEKGHTITRQHHAPQIGYTVVYMYISVAIENRVKALAQNQRVVMCCGAPKRLSGSRFVVKPKSEHQPLHASIEQA